MKFTFHLILIALFVAFAFAATATDEKQVIFNYPGDTPDSVIQQAIKALEAAGGVVTHEYKIIKGFAATAPASIISSIQAMSEKYIAMVEDDTVVSINGSPS